MKNYIRGHRYVLLLLYLPVYLLWFALVERMVPTTDMCWVSYLPLDDRIPFLPPFILAYVSWYAYLFVPVYVLLKNEDREGFLRYGWFIITGFSVSLLICMLWPNCQLLRPTQLDTSNFFEWVLSLIYAADTPTNVLPSMHVVGCMAVVSVCFDSPYLKKMRVPGLIWGALICASTVFVKQHSILDLFAGVALGLVLDAVIYGVVKKKMRARTQR